MQACCHMIKLSEAKARERPFTRSHICCCLNILNTARCCGSQFKSFSAVLRYSSVCTHGRTKQTFVTANSLLTVLFVTVVAAYKIRTKNKGCSNNEARYSTTMSTIKTTDLFVSTERVSDDMHTRLYIYKGYASLRHVNLRRKETKQVRGQRDYI